MWHDSECRNILSPWYCVEFVVQFPTEHAANFRLHNCGRSGLFPGFAHLIVRHWRIMTRDSVNTGPGLIGFTSLSRQKHCYFDPNSRRFCVQIVTQTRLLSLHHKAQRHSYVRVRDINALITPDQETWTDTQTESEERDTRICFVPANWKIGPLIIPIFCCNSIHYKKLQ